MANVVVITSPHAGSLQIVTNSNPPEYYLNLKNVKISGDNPFLPGTSTLNPQATVYGMLMETGYKMFEIFLSDITTIAGVARPATLALTITAIAVLVAE